MRPLLVFSLAVLAACSSSNPTPSASPEPALPPPPPPPPIASIEPVVDAGAPGIIADPRPKADPAFAKLPPSLPITLADQAKSPKVVREGKTWPFHKWDRAEAVVLNWVRYGPKTVLRAYDDSGWTHKLAYRTSLDLATAKRAVDLVLEAKGELEVSKCAVPRHGVILYEGDTPVASINVCFSCHDILLWPTTPSKPDADKRADAVLPKWEKLFAGELHFPMWPKNEP